MEDQKPKEHPSDLHFIVVEESTAATKYQGPETPPDLLINPTISEELSLAKDYQYDSYIISTKTVSLAFQTYENEFGERLFPWELTTDDTSSPKGQEERAFSLGPIVEVDVIVIRPNERFEVNENEITLATDLKFLYVIWPSLGEMPELTTQNEFSESSVVTRAPWAWLRLSVLEKMSTNLYYVHGDMQIAAQVISNGIEASLFNEKERTGAFPSSGSNLRLAKGPTIMYNNTQNPHIETNFDVTILSGYSQYITYALFFDGSGNVKSHIAVGGLLTFS